MLVLKPGSVLTERVLRSHPDIIDVAGDSLQAVAMARAAVAEQVGAAVAKPGIELLKCFARLV